MQLQSAKGNTTGQIVKTDSKGTKGSRFLLTELQATQFKHFIFGQSKKEFSYKKDFYRKDPVGSRKHLKRNVYVLLRAEPRPPLQKVYEFTDKIPDFVCELKMFEFIVK